MLYINGCVVCVTLVCTCITYAYIYYVRSSVYGYVLMCICMAVYGSVLWLCMVVYVRVCGYVTLS